MIWYILLAVVAVIGIIALIASTKPDEWTIQLVCAPMSLKPIANALTLESYVTDRWTKNTTNVVYFDNVVIAREYVGPARRS
jgi:hypothetical protein